MCQVHAAANALMQTWWLERFDPLTSTARTLAYHQRRNAAARRSHTKSTKRRLRRLGITLGNLKQCNTS